MRGTHERVLPGMNGRYLPTGHLTFVRKPDPRSEAYTLWAVPFDLARRRSQPMLMSCVDNIRVNQTQNDASSFECGRSGVPTRDHQPAAGNWCGSIVKVTRAHCQSSGGVGPILACRQTIW